MTVCTHGLSLDSPCVRCELQRPAIGVPFRNPADDNVERAVLQERSRARAILMHFFGSDWHGNAALKMLDEGEWPEGKK